MTQEEFIDAVVDVVLGLDSSSIRLDPDAVDEPLSSLLKWYRSLSQDDQQRVESLMRDAEAAALFGFLCILDGVRPIEDGAKGRLSLLYRRAGETTELNSEELPMLHDLFLERHTNLPER